MEGGVKDRVGAGLDQLLPLGERLAHLAAHRAGGVRDEPGDQPRRLPAASGPGRLDCGAGEPVVHDLGDVVGVLEPACRDQAREQGVEVVVVGLGPP